MASHRGLAAIVRAERHLARVRRVCQIHPTMVDGYGPDRWHPDQLDSACGPGLSAARVTAVDRGRYMVRAGDREVPAELTGSLRNDVGDGTELPCVGDWVCVRHRDGGIDADIHGVLPRRSFLRRKVAGRDIAFQMIAANVDVAFIVQGCDFDFNIRRLERYLAIVRDGHIDPVVVLTKTDLVTSDALDELVGRVRQASGDIDIVCVSNATGSGVDRVRERVVAGTTCCLLGSSGVGKTTLINRLLGDGGLPTREVSQTGEGRHTTTRRQMLEMPNGGLLIDMPGMRELGMLGAGEGIELTFADIGDLAERCRYRDCRHEGEPGCEVQAAVARHDLTDEHLEHYRKLRSESEFHEMSYLDRRRKERELGRLYRIADKRRHGPK